MKKNSILIYSILSFFILLFSVFFSYSIVFWANSTWSNISLSFKLTNTIYPDSLSLKDTKIGFNSDVDLSNYKITSSCDMYSDFINNYSNLYLFDIRFFDSDCDSSYLYLENELNQKVYSMNFNIISEYDIYESLIDYSTDTLEAVLNWLEEKKENLSKYKWDFTESLWVNYYIYLKNNRLFQEAEYNIEVVTQILNARQEKYLIPVEWIKLPTLWSKVPNSWRPYRSSYTDWIHHWWDFDWNYWDEVRALDDWIIVRVVSGFEWDNYDNLVFGNDITDEVKIKNLDILRGNQVWLKTSKWDVVFYSHLSDIYDNIKEWMVVKKWQNIWNIWATGVPDKSYTDYHLHLPIHKNPYIIENAWTYTYDDYMNWDWYLKWESVENVLKEQYKIFE